MKTRIRAARKTNDQLVLACRVISVFVPAPDFNNAVGFTVADVASHAKKLRALFTQYREQYKTLRKTLQRKTLGSAWRVVVDPQEAGWNVEIRQLLLVPPGKRALPWMKIRAARTVYLESVKAADDDAVYPLLGRFAEYPKGLLTSYVELSAAYVQASYGLRLITGTGAFRTCGDGLVRAFKKDKKHGEATSTVQPDKTNRTECDSAEDEVPL